MKKIFKLILFSALLTGSQMQANFAAGLFSLAGDLLSQVVDTGYFAKNPGKRKCALGFMLVVGIFGLFSSSKRLGMQANSLFTGKPLTQKDSVDDEKKSLPSLR